MKLSKLLFASALMASAAMPMAASGDAEMDSFIDNLMKKMTLQEKIGQLNLPVTGETATLPDKSARGR